MGCAGSSVELAIIVMEIIAMTVMELGIAHNARDVMGMATAHSARLAMD